MKFRVYIFLAVCLFFLYNFANSKKVTVETFYEFQVPESITIRDMFARSDRHMRNEFGSRINTLPMDATFMVDGKERGGPICR